MPGPPEVNALHPGFQTPSLRTVQKVSASADFLELPQPTVRDMEEDMPRLNLIFATFTLCLLPLAASGQVQPTAINAELRASTVQGSHAPADGTLDTTAAASLLFRATGQQEIAIPYAGISQLSVVDQDILHLSGIPALAWIIILPKPKRHLISITWSDGASATQVVTFEVSGSTRTDLLPVLEGRAANACERREEFGSCQPIVIPQRPPALTPRVAPSTETITLPARP